MLEKLLSILVGVLQDFRKVRFRCHRGFFATGSDEQVFLTITNLSRSREIEITHVWLATTPQIAALVSQRPLPKRLKADEVWETWIPVGAVPEQHRLRVLELGRVRLSTGRIVKSREDADVPHEGTVPGEAESK